MKALKWIVAGTLALSAAGAFAHAKLESSEPKAASVLDAAPKRIHLQFNEALEQAFSKIALTGPHNAAVALPKAAVDKDNPKAMTVALPALQAGQYRVQWSTLTHDGHKTKGEFTFKVK